MDTTGMNASAAPVVFCPHNGTAHDGTLVCHWADSPGTRGTRNIIWLCLSTLGICVWSAVHPGVPHPGSSRLRRLGTRVEWLLLGLLMPELLVLTALGELRTAIRTLRGVESNGLPTEFPWWMKRRQYAPSHTGYRRHPWTLTHSFYAVMGGYHIADYSSNQPGSAPLSTLRLANHWLVAPSLSHAAQLTDVAADDLADRSKADGLAKLLLVWQLCVFLANCAARLRQGLPLSLLEVTTISHSLCSIVALVMWWYKPHSVGEAIMLDGSSPGQPSSGWDRVVLGPLMPDETGQHIMDVPRTVTMLAIAVLYGLPHLLGRSVHFPSSAEKTLWDVATFAVIVFPVVLCILLWMTQLQLPTYHIAVERRALLTVSVVASMYAACSLFLLAESLRQVFALPEDSFREPQLARYLPSFS